MVWEDERMLAFLDVRPLFAGHVLLIPRQHVDNMLDLPEDLAGPLFEQTCRIAEAVETALGAEGSFVAVNNKVSQTVPHLHIHVVPRRRGDGLKGFFWPRHKLTSEEMAATAARLRAALSDS
jgi:histidine triad (HIT) family protein